MAFTQEQITACRHPRENARFALALVVSILILPVLAFLMIISVVTLLLPLIALLLWFGQELFFYRMLANSVLVSDSNYPRIHQFKLDLIEQLELRRHIDIFVFDEGKFNAYLVRILNRRAILLDSEMLESGVNDDEIKWVIGRFVGYWRVQQDYGIAGMIIRVVRKFVGVNLFTLPFERAVVYSGDRLGLLAIAGDVNAAVSAMQKFFVGRLMGYSVNPVGIVEQASQIKGNLFAFWSRVGSSFPHTVSRYADLLAFAERAYPRHFAQFVASNPGMPDNLHAISAESASGAFGKGIAAYAALAALAVLPIVAIAYWASALAPAQPTYDPNAPYPMIAPSPTYDDNFQMSDPAMSGDSYGSNYDDTMGPPADEPPTK